MTKIIATIGPASEDIGSLMYFKEHDVEIARLNFSHNTSQWHIHTAKLARKAGLEIMFDLAGPKVILGDLSHEIQVANKSEIILEKQKPNVEYPNYEKVGEKTTILLPLYYDLKDFVLPSHQIMIDDGKVELKVLKIENEKIFCEVVFGGTIKSHKGINLPDSSLDLDFLVKRDRVMLADTVSEVKPEYIAPSFVKTLRDLKKLENYLKEILESAGIENYMPKICTKIEMGEAVDDKNLSEIVDYSDMIMIARGDLALETKPSHLKVPFLQEKIKQICKSKNKPFIVATQILESMMQISVPTRAEISDLYRAIYLDNADFIMLSGESAAGYYPKKAIKVMFDMIHYTPSSV
jgi:pyruvate kinase